MNDCKKRDTREPCGPLLFLQAKKPHSDILSGQQLKVIATGAKRARGYHTFSRQTRNDLVEWQTVGAALIHVLRRH